MYASLTVTDTAVDIVPNGALKNNKRKWPHWGAYKIQIVLGFFIAAARTASLICVQYKELDAAESFPG